MISSDDIERMLDLIEKVSAEMESLERDIFHKRIELIWRGLTYEQAYDFWVREIRPKRDLWCCDCRYCFRAFGDWCRDGGVSETKWESVKSRLEVLNRAYKSFEDAHRDFIHDLDVRWHRKKAFCEGQQIGFDKGRKEGLEEGVAITQKPLLDKLDQKEREKKELKKTYAKLDKPHMRMDRDQWEKSVFGEVKRNEQDVGLKGAVRVAIREKWVIDGAKHFKTFGSDGEDGPTFEALLQSFKRSKEKPKAKKTKQRSRPKRRPCDFADDGVEVKLPSEQYKE